MTPLQRYIAEEIAVDHADGIFTRREAIRRLGLLGIGVAAASSLLAACSSDSGTTAASTTAAATRTDGPPPGMTGAVASEPVTFAGPEGRTLQGAWAAAAEPRGSVLVIHENKGLTDHIRSVAGRFAGAGYSAIAVDLLSEEGGTAKFTDPAEATAALAKIPADRFVADMKATVDELERRVPGKKAAAIGFCFGGGLVWQLLASGEPRLAAASPFYGPLPENADFGGSKAAVLAVYAALDTRVSASRDAATAALVKAGLDHQVVTEPGADHAFFNDTGPRYNPTAANDVWKKVLDWFGRYVG
ncbi:dienelactone hydrolase family protein [Antrihabitans cavernicola]|uniref:Dienelactone hydrolase family protein n=1 Tax=Antrihabitans cavernicola TaxID=2495913 RepID=A0A5A7SDF6_9NOCA|nr:dienelactone hydrolase family protein [Spelaeibacter cavernicola]KAA0024188.1 dienelactone hydrolase family protein [Spelaeibacter cavernicola]